MSFNCNVNKLQPEGSPRFSLSKNKNSVSALLPGPLLCIFFTTKGQELTNHDSIYNGLYTAPNSSERRHIHTQQQNFETLAYWLLSLSEAMAVSACFSKDSATSVSAMGALVVFSCAFASSSTSSTNWLARCCASASSSGSNDF